MFNISNLFTKSKQLEDIYTFKNFLNSNECSLVLENIKNHNFNKARQFSIGRNNKEIFTQDEKLKLFITKKTKNTDNLGIIVHKFTQPLEFYRYDTGDFITAHTDAPRPFSNSKESNYTAIIYLNDNFDGGQTYFNDLDRSIKPEEGLLLIFKHSLKHEAVKVNAGVKYIYRSNWLISR